MELHDQSKIRDKSFDWVMALKPADLRSTAIMMYTRYPNSYKSCILEFKSFTLDDLNSLSCGPKLLELAILCTPPHWRRRMWKWALLSVANPTSQA